MVKELWGKYAGLVSAVLYMFAPYKALDIYVRGALAESMALTLIPFVLYFAYKKNYKLFTIFLFIFLVTHNIMTIVFLPVVVLWIIYLVFSDKQSLPLHGNSFEVVIVDDGSTDTTLQKIHEVGKTLNYHL